MTPQYLARLELIMTRIDAGPTQGANLHGSRYAGNGISAILTAGYQMVDRNKLRESRNKYRTNPIGSVWSISCLIPSKRSVRLDYSLSSQPVLPANTPLKPSMLSQHRSQQSLFSPANTATNAQLGQSHGAVLTLAPVVGGRV